MNFKPTFSLSSFIKRLFSSSLLSAIRVVSSAYLRLLICLPAILIPACASSSLMAESKEELKNLLMKVKEESEEAGLKLNIQKMIMVSGPITSWQIDEEMMEIVTDFIFFIILGSKITADGDRSHEIKRRLVLGRKVMTNLDSILKSRDIADKGLYSQSYGFSGSHVWM